ARARQRDAFGDPGRTRRIQIVQRARFTIGIPPAARELAETRKLFRTDVVNRFAHVTILSGHQRIAAMRSRQRAVVASSASISTSINSPFEILRCPAIHTSLTCRREAAYTSCEIG